jgi:DDE superfamily endonuclease
MRARKSVAGEHTPEASLRAFRARLHAFFNRCADAPFELTDAILTAGSIPSPPHLSLTPVHRRGWGSHYAALSKGRIEEKAVRGLLARYPMVHDDKDRTPVYAVDVAPWPRCGAEASPERGYYYHPDTREAPTRAWRASTPVAGEAALAVLRPFSSGRRCTCASGRPGSGPCTCPGTARPCARRSCRPSQALSRLHPFADRPFELP